MNSIPTFVRWLTVCCALALSLALAGCEPPAPRVAKDMAVGITGYNFTAEGVQEYYVNDRRGSNLPPYGGGGGTSCCVTLPGQWTPGLTVKVDWTMGDYTLPWSKLEAMTPEQRSACCWTQRTLSKTVPVERYGKEGGRVQVFFLPNDEIKVWVSDYDLGFPGHPSGVPYPTKPANAE
jgi:hypothetical protein